MAFSVQGDCQDNDITSFETYVASVDYVSRTITLCDSIPGDGACLSASIEISGCGGSSPCGGSTPSNSSSSSNACAYQNCTGLVSDPVVDCSETVVPPGYALDFDCELCECIITQVFPTGGSTSSSSSSPSGSHVSFSLTNQPTNKTISVGEGTASLFSVTAVSPSPISYKWQISNNFGISYYDINPTGGVFYGANSPTLGLNAGMADMSSTWNNARFQCVVVSGGSTLVSGFGVLTVS